MDTACVVGIQHVIGQIEYITITWDGAHVGEVLHTCYQTREQVLDLIRGGSRPFLDGPDDILEEEGDLPGRHEDRRDRRDEAGEEGQKQAPAERDQESSESRAREA